MKREQGFRANDGTWFSTAVECKAHEKEAVLRRLIDMTGTEVLAAIDRTDVSLAAAIEFAGQLISAKRRADGDLRRKKKTTGSLVLAAKKKAAGGA
jgi:hypothetical protein